MGCVADILLNASIPKENISLASASVANIRSHRLGIDFKSPEKVFDLWGYEYIICEDDGSLCFVGAITQKDICSQDEEFWRALAPYLDPGCCVLFYTDDDFIWKYEFFDGKMKEYTAEWEEADE